MQVEWIEQAVQYAGKASIRHRRLPVQQVVWLVVALALYRHQSISEVLDDLDLALPNLQTPFVSKSAIGQARQRLGAAPLQALYDLSARAWCEQDARHYQFKGLRRCRPFLRQAACLAATVASSVGRAPE